MTPRLDYEALIAGLPSGGQFIIAVPTMKDVVALQSERAKARHAKGKAEGKTCIDCHFGIAHKEPDGPGPQELKLP